MRGKRGSGTSVPFSTRSEIDQLISSGVRGYTVQELKTIEAGLIKYTKQMYTRMGRKGVLTPMMEQVAVETSRRTSTGKLVAFSRLRGDEATRVNYINRVNDYLSLINSNYFGIKGGRKFKDKYESETNIKFDISNKRLWRIYGRLKERKVIEPCSPPEEWLPKITMAIIDNPEFSDDQIVLEVERRHGPSAVPKRDTKEV